MVGTPGRPGPDVDGGGGGGCGAGPPPLPVAEPVTPRESVSPFAVNVTLPAKLPALVGWNRTTTACEAPGFRENEPPDTTRNGAAMLADPESAEPPVFATVKVRSAVAPLAMLPKLVAAVGVTLMSGWATPLAAAEHGPSLPAPSTAVTRAK
jgi:hypothetical protein